MTDRSYLETFRGSAVARALEAGVSLSLEERASFLLMAGEKTTDGRKKVRTVCAVGWAVLDMSVDPRVQLDDALERILRALP